MGGPVRGPVAAIAVVLFSALDPHRVRRRIRQRVRRLVEPAGQEDRRSPSTAPTSRPTAPTSTSRSGQPLEFDVTADKPGEIHVHSSPRSRSSSTRPAAPPPGQADPGADPGDRRVAHPRQDARSARRSVTCPMTRARRRGSSPSTAWAAPRTCPISRGAGDPRCGGGGRGLLRRPGAGLAQPAVRRRRPAAGSAPPWLARRSSTRPCGAALLRLVGLVALVYLVVRRGLRQGPPAQPDLRHLLRLDLGRHGRRLAAVRSGLAGDQPLPADQRRPSPASPAVTPTTGCSPTPSGSGMWPAALGLFAFVWMELVYPHNVDLSPVRLWCAIYFALMIVGGAVFGNTFYARADPFEVYSTPGRPAVGVGPARRAAGRPQPVGQPRHDACRRPAWWRWSRCCSAARRSTRSATRRAG